MISSLASNHKFVKLISIENADNKTDEPIEVYHFLLSRECSIFLFNLIVELSYEKVGYFSD